MHFEYLGRKAIMRFDAGGWSAVVGIAMWRFDATTAVLSSEAFALSSSYLAGVLLVLMTTLMLVVPCMPCCTSKALLSQDKARSCR